MRVSLTCAAVVVLGCVLPVSGRAQSMFDQIVIKKCASAMQADFDKAGKTPPAGLIQQTCSCVTQQLAATHNLDTAKTICTQQAAAGLVK